MGDIVFLEIIVESYEIEPNLFGNNVNCRATGESRIHVHHASIEAVAGISRHTMLRLEIIVSMIPVAESHQIGVSELASLGNAGRTTGVEHDKQVIRLYGYTWSRSAWQCINIGGEQHISFIFINQRTQFGVDNQQLGAGVFHHEIEAFGGIAWVKRLISATCLEHTHRSNRHPLASRNEHAHHVFLAESHGSDSRSNAIANIINL